jgi:ribose/xylose/arabinose/galactoside ABC-type transport system permease subunit
MAAACEAAAPLLKSDMHNEKTSIAFLARNWALVFLFTLLVFFSLFGQNFFSVRNFNNIMIAATTTLLLATGETFVIISGGIDLSIGFVMGFVAVSSATVMQRLYAKGEGYPELFCIVVGCLAGLLLGLIQVGLI